MDYNKLLLDAAKQITSVTKKSSNEIANSFERFINENIPEELIFKSPKICLAYIDRLNFKNKETYQAFRHSVCYKDVLASINSIYIPIDLKTIKDYEVDYILRNPFVYRHNEDIINYIIQYVETIYMELDEYVKFIKFLIVAKGFFNTRLNVMYIEPADDQSLLPLYMALGILVSKSVSTEKLLFNSPQEMKQAFDKVVEMGIAGQYVVDTIFKEMNKYDQR
jgi:hypothetical protein